MDVIETRFRRSSDSIKGRMDIDVEGLCPKRCGRLVIKALRNVRRQVRAQGLPLNDCFLTVLVMRGDYLQTGASYGTCDQREPEASIMVTVRHDFTWQNRDDTKSMYQLLREQMVRYLTDVPGLSSGQQGVKQELMRRVNNNQTLNTIMRRHPDLRLIAFRKLHRCREAVLLTYMPAVNAAPMIGAIRQGKGYHGLIKRLCQAKVPVVVDPALTSQLIDCHEPGYQIGYAFYRDIANIMKDVDRHK